MIWMMLIGTRDALYGVMMKVTFVRDGEKSFIILPACYNAVSVREWFKKYIPKADITWMSNDPTALEPQD